jgi:quercetin dioxygenase-like cupin family protein
MRRSRRELALLLPACAAMMGQAQTNSKTLPSAALKFEDLPVKNNPTSKQRAVFKGLTHSGFPIEMHITELQPGQAPHAPHHHVHEEMMLVQRGVLDCMVNGKTTRLTAGSVFYIYSNEEHGIKNAGTEPVQYFVVALGVENV